MHPHGAPLGSLVASSLPRRDRIAILLALAGVTGLAWAYLIRISAHMATMGLEEVGMLVQIAPWTLTDFIYMGLMWTIMMVGMMVPSAAPHTLMYAAIVRKAAREGTPLAPTMVFIGGYLVIWTIFSVGATTVQWAFHQTALLSPMMVTTSIGLGAGILMAAGIYQLTPWKEACLDHCRSPVHFISQHWKPGVAGSFRMGLEHGVFCLGCCWALMGLLFVGGVMNFVWIAGIALFVFLEKVLPFGARGGRLAGALMILMGGTVLVSWLLGTG